MSSQHCPLLKKSCIEQKCRWYIQLLGKHPQKDGPVPEWGCAVEWLPILLIENAQQTRHFAAATESARNESVKNAEIIATAISSLGSVTLPVQRISFWRRLPFIGGK